MYHTDATVRKIIGNFSTYVSRIDVYLIAGVLLVLRTKIPMVNKAIFTERLKWYVI